MSREGACGSGVTVQPSGVLPCVWESDPESVRAVGLGGGSDGFSDG